MDEMDSRERIDAAIALQPVDRVPIIPLMDIVSPRFQGVTQAQVIREPDLGREMMIKTFDDLGGWDATFSSGATMETDIGGAPFVMACKLPGYELSDDVVWQLDEKEIMKVADYDFILKNGWNAYMVLAYPRLGAPVPPDQFIQRLGQIAAQSVKDTQIWEAKGVSLFSVTGALPAFESLSMTRSLKEVITDIYRRPDIVEATIDVIMAEQIPMSIANFQELKKVTKWGSRVMFIGATRSPFLSPPNFDRFFWKYLKSEVNQLLDAGITPLLHFDSNWERYLERFLELPKGQVILELDSTTNIFKAKEILKGHMCLMGDVSASLLKLGTPEEVTAYVKKLIDVVGDGNGFILSTGCDCPIDAKFENVKAMIDTGKNYYPHHKVF